MENKRILTVQDISCLGQCSATVALPILSAFGLETCILPTALLSTHTGGFRNPAVLQLGDMASRIHAHWKREGITFDAIYTGYLGSVAAVHQVQKLMDDLLIPGGVCIVDPAMADHGRLYSGLSAEYAEAMKALCNRADILLPNLTEAAMLSGQPFRNGMEENDICALLDGLPQRNVVLTGVDFSDTETGVLIRQGECLTRYPHKKVPGAYHGTGDIFAACFTGAYLRRKNLTESAMLAADLTSLCVQNTHANPAHSYGTRFETIIPEIIRLVQTDCP